jgi:16S rRNA (adenine1518-N6/adenine1519-N6)-dimethyltransferase
MSEAFPTRMPLPTPKKSLGQCFLAEREYARQIAQAVAGSECKSVLEIGPGRGMLTEELLRAGLSVTAVEIDQRLIEPLQAKFGADPRFVLRHEDFLDTDFEPLLPRGEFTAAGNLPYHLVSEVLFKLFAQVRAARRNPLLPWPERAVLMMQKEVADRVVAAPGTKDWSKLSVFTQLEAAVHLLFTVPADAFRPAPKVDGGVVQLDFYRIPPSYPSDFTVFERMVRYTFHQRRKMLKTSLPGLAGIHPFWQLAPLDFTRRPETLHPAEWVILSDVVSRAQSRPSS